MSNETPFFIIEKHDIIVSRKDSLANPILSLLFKRLTYRVEIGKFAFE